MIHFMAKRFTAFLFICVLVCFYETCGADAFTLRATSLLTNVLINFIGTKHTVLFTCHGAVFLEALRNFLCNQQRVQIINIDRNFSLHSILVLESYARTTIILDTYCANSKILLQQASYGRYLNKTYQWVLWANGNTSAQEMLPSNLYHLGPNAQITFINRTKSEFQMWDIHSKGHHLKSPLELQLIGYFSPSEYSLYDKVNYQKNLHKIQGIHFRDQFRGLRLRAATVIDLENVTSNKIMEELLSATTKHAGISPFTKYHFDLVVLLRERFNFTLNFRNARGWASRMATKNFRFGYLGIMARDEADIGASAIFNRINRFAEFDIIYQGWKFETAFLYRYIPGLHTKGRIGSFFTPFENQVWIFTIFFIIIVTLVWYLVENTVKQLRLCKSNLRMDLLLQRTTMCSSRRAKALYNKEAKQKNSYCTNKRYINRYVMKIFCKAASIHEIILKTISALCQQGIDPLPRNLPSQIIVISLFLCALVLYNFYTSSVVGGLLIISAKGPSTIDELISSSLTLSFEDIGYYKVLFKENKADIITNLIKFKLSKERIGAELPIYTNLETAIPYLKNGTHAFHCELVDAYPEIEKKFDAAEICALRIVRGLLESEVMNWVVHKNSEYAEIFRLAIYSAREAGLTHRLLHQRRPSKPRCQSLYVVYPVTFSAVSNAYLYLCGGFLLSIVVMVLENVMYYYIQNKSIN